MPALAMKNRLLLTLVLLMVLAGCGGAQARKEKHLEKAHGFMTQGNFEKARVELRNALQIAPNDSATRYENGIIDEKLGNPREAAQFYQGAIEANPDNVPARASLGRLFLFSGVPESALEIIKPALVKHPDDAALLTVRAAARTQLKDAAGALQDAERAVGLAPANEDAVAVLAGIYKSQGNSEKARGVLEKALKIAPNSVDLRLALAQLYASLGQEPQLEALLIELIGLRPNDKAHRIRLAQYYARLNHIEEAERVLREAIKALPGERDLKVGLVDFLAARRNREVAQRELSAMIAASPKDYDLKFAQAQFFEQGQDFKRAEAIYKEIIAATDLDPPGITARNRLAALRIRSADTAGAQKLLGEVLAKSPRDNDALILRGNLALAQKDPKSAIADLRAVLRDQPNAIGVMRALARAHIANNEPALAEETMRRAVDASPQDADARLDLAQLLLQVAKADQAKPVIEELVKQQPNNMAALDAQFRVAVATKDLVEARAAADAMVATEPKKALGYLYQGALAETNHHLEEALRLYVTALGAQPETTEPLQAVTRVLVNLKRVPEALKRLDEVNGRYPASPYAYNLKGEILLSLQRHAEAQAAFKAAIARDKKWWFPYRGLAYAQSLGGNNAAAVASLQAGIPSVERPDALESELANLYERLGKPDDAIRVYEAAMRRDPHSDLSANNLAMLLATYKKDQPSLNRAKELVARFSDSDNAAFLDTYGWVLYKRGESAAAVAALQAALAKSPDAPVSLYHLGMAQASAGQTAAARDSLMRSLRAGTNFSGMDEAKATLDKLAKLTPAGAVQPAS